ncbi:MAG TPA: hypothetical protein VHL78_07220 [Actinomycetota bacterium]|nr:hypothetical protein [Actinomycetota bacterium]
MTLPPDGFSAGPRRRRRPSPVIVVLLAGLVAAAAVAVAWFLEADPAGREAAEPRGRPRDGRPVEREPEQDDPLLEALEELLRGGGLPGDEELAECVAAGGPPGPGVPTAGGIRAEVRAVARQVERIRELRFEDRVEPEFVTPEEMARRVRRLFEEEYTPALAEADRRILGALGAVPRDVDLRELRGRALEGQVAGFYIPSTGELVVRSSGEGLEPLDRVTLAHELEHALADQRFDLPIPERLRVGHEDADLAGLALVEGDATLTMQRYALGLPFADQLALFDPAALAQAGAGLKGLPPYLQRELLFPYEGGLRFVCALFSAGGWDAVDGAYAEPPASTSQILFPERYARRQDPVDPADPARPGPRWSAEPARSFGAVNLLWLFEAPGGAPQRAVAAPLRSAGAWGGGEVHLWTRGPRSAVAMALAERPGTDLLCRGVTAWYRAAFPGAEPVSTRPGERLAVQGGAQDALVACTEDQVLVAIAPDLDTARAMAAGPP